MNNFDRLSFMGFFWALVWAIPAQTVRDNARPIMVSLLVGTGMMVIAMFSSHVDKLRTRARAGRKEGWL